MENIITPSGFGSGKNESLIYGAGEEGITHESKIIRNPVQRFKAFCERQQENRLGWTALTIGGQLCILAPITLSAIVINGNPLVLWIPVILSSFAVVLCNLMALSTKIVLPVFFTSVLINVGVITLSTFDMFQRYLY